VLPTRRDLAFTESCKQIRHEALEVWYSQSSWDIMAKTDQPCGSKLEEWLEDRGNDQRWSIRRVNVCIFDYESSPSHGFDVLKDVCYCFADTRTWISLVLLFQTTAGLREKLGTYEDRVTLEVPMRGSLVSPRRTAEDLVSKGDAYFAKRPIEVVPFADMPAGYRWKYTRRKHEDGPRKQWEASVWFVQAMLCILEKEKRRIGEAEKAHRL